MCMKRSTDTDLEDEGDEGEEAGDDDESDGDLDQTLFSA